MSKPILHVSTNQWHWHRQVRRVAATAALFAAATATHADPFAYSSDFGAGVGSEWAISTSYNNGDAGILGQLQDGSATLTVDGLGGGTSSLDFDLLGFRTIDGYNCCTDYFRLYLNGAEVFRGVFGMGGGGSDGVELNSLGAVVSGGGSSRHIGIGSLTLAAGTNTLRFDYGGLQGFGDEAWGLDNIAMAGEVAAAVPEPETYALLLAGLGLVGLATRRKR
ncbi:MAG TPA: PEP-CTERM sorting domain-containing protein [Thiobacillaceae bacterium]|nr:PEP-CTERM sorting domain-containing protein [Thiobacillaceae bacterium]